MKDLKQGVALTLYIGSGVESGLERGERKGREIIYKVGTVAQVRNDEGLN